MCKENARENRRKVLLEGMRDGLPIGLGYFAVAFALGIDARNVGVNAVQGFVASFLTIASAGEHAGFSMIGLKAGLLTTVGMLLIANARYLLMSFALAQRLAPGTKFVHRFFVGAVITDELFGITVARPGFLNPFYTYGAALVAVPLWALGTSFGILFSNYVMNERIVSALSVALYGMFIAIIIPPSRKSKVVFGCVAVSFLMSFLCGRISFIADRIDEGTRTILLTLIIASAAALLFPVKEEKHE